MACRLAGGDGARRHLAGRFMCASHHCRRACIACSARRSLHGPTGAVGGGSTWDDLLRSIGPALHGDTIRLRGRASGWLLSGALHRIPWYRFVDGIVVIAESDDGPRTVVVDQHPPTRTSANWADEPRDDLVFDDVAVDATRVRPGRRLDGRPTDLPRSARSDHADARGTRPRSVADGPVCAGARPVRQADRQVSGHSATGCAARIPGRCSECRGGRRHASGRARRAASRFEIACAKARVAEAVAVASEIAHGVHAAMGFSREHDLNRYTRRLWSWREEFGSDNQWHAWIGKAAALQGGERLWEFVTAPARETPSRAIG